MKTEIDQRANIFFGLNKNTPPVPSAATIGAAFGNASLPSKTQAAVTAIAGQNCY